MEENNNSDKSGQECMDDLQKCCPSASSVYSKMKLVVFAVVVIAAGLILAHSLMQESTAASDDIEQVFASILQEENDAASPQVNVVTEEEGGEISPAINAVANVAASGKTELTLWGAELESFASLNKVAAESDAVFVFLAGEGQEGNEAMTKEIEAAVKKIQSDGNRIIAFRLKKAAPEYSQLAKQLSVPCVLAMVKGRGMSAVSGEINKGKLIGAFVTASRAVSGCGPSGCGPSSDGQPGCP